MKRILYCIVLITSLFLLYEVKEEWDRYQYYQSMISEQTKAMRIEGSLGPSKVVVDIEEKTPWELIFKAVFTILSTSLGLALIKKYIK